jgi:hypothetical protein
MALGEGPPIVLTGTAAIPPMPCGAVFWRWLRKEIWRRPIMPSLLHKRIGMNAVAAFCEKHKVSMDWLLCGDLQGLQRMTQEARAEPPAGPVVSEPYNDLLTAFGKLDSAGRRAIVKYLNTQT